jgi:PrtD family type I secretion system ABC transporter
MNTEASKFRRILGHAKPVLVSAMAFSLFINLLILSVPVYMIQLFDRVLTSESQATLVIITGGVLGALLIAAGLELARSRMLVRLGVWLERRLNQPLFAASLANGRLAHNFRDLEKVRSLFMGNSLTSVFDAPWTPVFILVLFSLHPSLGWIAAAGAGVLGALAFVTDAASRRSHSRAVAAAAGQYRAAAAIGRQRDVVAGLGMETGLSKWWRRQIGAASQFHQSGGDAIGLAMVVSRFVRLGLQILVLASAAHLVINGQLSAGAMIAASILLSRALAPVEQLIGAWRQLRSARQSLRRIAEVLGDSGADAQFLPLPRPEGRIEATNLRFQPRTGGPIVFSEVSFKIEPGNFAALVGPSGAGKTSLIRMLAGALAPASGLVRLDGADIAGWPAHDRGRHVGYVPQHVEFLPGTVAENIARFEDAAADHIYEAAREAGVHGDILRLPEGYQTRLGGEEGILSAGMRQRLALARAVFGKPALLLLDEPHSNLDNDGVGDLIHLVERFTGEGGAVLMATHRPSIYVRADQTFELKDGGLTEIRDFGRTRLSLHGAGAGPRLAQIPMGERLLEARS